MDQRRASTEPPATAGDEAERLHFLLDYVGTDYGHAVREGQVADASEYREMVGFTALLVERFDALRRRGAAESTRAGLEQLRRRVLDRAPWTEIHELVSQLTQRLASELGLRTPAEPLDRARGAALYREDCAICHGTEGRGDGSAAAGLEPAPTSFHGEQMDLLSLRHLYGAVNFGIDGTAMPSYAGALDASEIWDIAFFVAALRDLPGQAVARRGAVPADRAADGATAGEDADLELAARLESAFARVAERVFPGVVGVSSFVRRSRAETERAAAPPPAGGTWTGPAEEELFYPGFRRLHSGSGFIVTPDGYLLTCHHLLTTEEGELAEAIDVELGNGQHILSRVVGTEPAVNLAVLQLEVFPEHNPPTLSPVAIGDSDRVALGHWAIALGDPWGPAKSYAVGTFSGLPARQCYQAELSATLFESSARIPAEAFGGPLANIRGEVVGLITPAPARLASRLPATEPADARFGATALPINVARGIYEALKVKESRRSPWLGFSVLDVAAVRRTGGSRALPRTGVCIDDAFAPSPASRGGILVGDCVVAIDDHRLLSVLDFQKWLYLSGVGRTVDLELFRDGDTLHKQVTIEVRPPELKPR